MAPKIVVEYHPAESALMKAVFDDGKCGYLDIEDENGKVKSVKLKFKKKDGNKIIIPLEVGKYRVTHRTKSKASMLASDVLTSINEGNGAAGAFANAVYEAGGMSGKLSSVVIDAGESFILTLSCKIDGLEKICNIVSCTQ